MKRLCLLVLPLAAGCVAAAVGAAVAVGVISVKNNEARRDYKADVQTTWAATKAEMEAQGYKFNYNADYAVYSGKLESADTKVTVEVADAEHTRVRVTVGTFETDANISQATRLLKGIAKRLGEPVN
jgi:polyisoprenoid-binding protein YceI